jgi:hypothetical protein
MRDTRQKLSSGQAEAPVCFLIIVSATVPVVRAAPALRAPPSAARCDRESSYAARAANSQKGIILLIHGDVIGSRVVDVAQQIWMKTMTIKTFAPGREPGPVQQQDDRWAYKRSDRNRGRCGYRSLRDGNASAKRDRRYP